MDVKGREKSKSQLDVQEREFDVLFDLFRISRSLSERAYFEGFVLKALVLVVSVVSEV